MMDFLVYNASATVLTVLYIAIFIGSLYVMSKICKKMPKLGCEGLFRFTEGRLEMGFSAPWWMFLIYILVLMMILYIMVITSSFGLANVM